MILKDLLIFGKQVLNENNIQDADIILKILVQYIFKIEKEKIILYYDKDIENIDVEKYKKYLEKIVKGVPIQYIINNQEFMGLSFYVDENVLIPQPDTEILVQEIIEKYKNTNCKILDLCTGSGAIAISLAKNIENSKVFATDISMKALQIAKLNAEKNLVHRKMEFIESDMFENINEKEFDIIVSNPPYIKTSVISNLDIQVQNEPHIALDGGVDGLKFYKIIIENSYKYLKENGQLFLEIGYDQKDDVIKILNKNKFYYNIYSKKDFGNNDRIVVSTIRR